MQTVHETQGEGKSVAQKLTALAQLVAMHEKHEGVTSVADLVRITGYTDRAIRKAKAELRCREDDVKAEPRCRNYSSAPEPQYRNGTPVPEPEFHGRNQSSETEPEFRNWGSEAPRAHARIETPSGLSLSVRGLDSPSSVPLKPKSPRGARLQPDWALPDDWFDWTRINFAHATPDLIHLEAEKFRDYWTAKSGQQAAKLDWQATWRNWCRTAFATRPATVRQRPAEEHWQERNRREAREFLALCRGETSGAVQ